MSLVTTCPACGTRFRFNPVDVSAHGGEGRCSVCRHVFNALEHVSQQDDTPEANLPPQPEEVIAEPAESSPFTSEEIVEETAPVEHYQSEYVVANVTTREPLPEDLFLRKPSGLPPLMKQLTVVSLLLMVALVQIALFYRQQVITYLPSSYALLASLCKPLACTAPLPRQSAQISIEDYRLVSHPDFQDVLILESTLLNRARYPQSFPSLELTLTDEVNAPVALRRLLPEEYLASADEVAKGIPAGGSAIVQVYLNVNGIQSSKYRLVAKDGPFKAEKLAANDAS